MKVPRTTKDILAHADELAKRFWDYESREGDRRDQAALAKLSAAVVAHAEAERQLVDHIVAARKHGLSWSMIGAASGMSGEAVRQKYGPLLASLNER